MLAAERRALLVASRGRVSRDRQVTTLQFARACAGDATAAAEFSPVLYEQLRHIAKNLLRHERPGQTLQPTALVHEAYLLLVDESQLVSGPDKDAARARFLGMAANAMRQILIRHARARAAIKRGGGKERVDVDDLATGLPVHDTSLLDLDAALVQLTEINPTLARVAELRLFGGLSVRELAPVLEISLTTAKDQWALTRVWLGRLLGPPKAREESG